MNFPGFFRLSNWSGEEKKRNLFFRLFWSKLFNIKYAWLGCIVVVVVAVVIAHSVHDFGNDPFPVVFRVDEVIVPAAAATTQPTAPTTPATASSSSSHFCPVCQQEATKRCSKCKSVYYCSRECQIKVRHSHNYTCVSIQCNHEFSRIFPNTNRNANQHNQLHLLQLLPYPPLQRWRDFEFPPSHCWAWTCLLALFGCAICYLGQTITCESRTKLLSTIYCCCSSCSCCYYWLFTIIFRDLLFLARLLYPVVIVQAMISLLHLSPSLFASSSQPSISSSSTTIQHLFQQIASIITSNHNTTEMMSNEQLTQRVSLLCLSFLRRVALFVQSCSTKSSVAHGMSQLVSNNNNAQFSQEYESLANILSIPASLDEVLLTSPFSLVSGTILIVRS